MTVRIELKKPAAQFKDSFLEGMEEFDSAALRSTWVYTSSRSVEWIKSQFEKWVEDLLLRETKHLMGFVPDTTYWAVMDEKVVGRISIRHCLSPSLEKVGGHIGYIVRPSSQRKGVASEMLRQILLTERARAIGRLLLTIDENNLASEKSILKNGGVYEKTIDVDGVRKKHFWIKLSHQ